MARSNRLDTQRQSAPRVTQDLSDQARLAVPEGIPSDELEAAVEGLNLGHAALRKECWSGVSGMGSGSCRSESAPSRFAPQRLRRPPWRRAPLYHLRPRQAAEVRFTLDNREILTD